MYFNPILIRELRTQLRGVRSTVLISTFVGLLIAALVFMYRTIQSRAGLGSPLLNAQIGQALFSGLALLLQTLVVFIAPAITVSAISSEIEQRTLEFVVMTPVRPERIVVGKLLGALAYLAVLLCSVIPLFSVVLLFGGVTVRDIIRVFGVVVVTAVFGVMFGLFCSALLRRTAGATILCYTLLVALVGGTLFGATFWSVTNSQQAAPPFFVYANPLSAMASALVGRPSLSPQRPGARPEATDIGPNTLRPLALVGIFAQGTFVPAKQGSGVIIIPVYRATIVIFSLATILLFWASTHLVPPRRGLRLRPIDWVMLGLLVLAIIVAYLVRSWWIVLPD